MNTSRLPPPTSGKKSKPQPQPVSYSTAAYPEPNYAYYTHRNNVNAHLKPVTYGTVSNSSVVAQAGSTAGPAPSSHPQKVKGEGSSHKQQKHNRLSAYIAFEHSASKQPLTSSVLAFNPTTPPAKLHRKKKHQAGQTDAYPPPRIPNNSSIAMPVPQKAAKTHDAPSYKPSQHNGHVTAHQSMPNIASEHYNNGHATAGVLPLIHNSQYGTANKTKAQGPQSCLKPTTTTPSQHLPYNTQLTPYSQPTQVVIYQQHQPHYRPQTSVYPPQVPEHTAMLNTSNNLSAVAGPYIQQYNMSAPVSKPQGLNATISFAQLPQQVQYVQPISHSMPYMADNSGHLQYPQPGYGSQPTFTFASESTLFEKPKKQVHFAK